MSYSIVAPLVGVLTLVAIVGGTLHLLAAHDRITGRGEDERDEPPDGP